jgi:hypothetical protein
MTHLRKLAVEAIASKLLLGLLASVRSRANVRREGLARAGIDLSSKVIDKDLSR